MLTGVGAVLAIVTLLAGWWWHGQLEQGEDLVDEAQEAAFLKWYFHPSGAEMEGNLAGSRGEGGMWGFDVKTQEGNGAAAEPVWGRMLEGISVGVQLATVERDLGRGGVGSFKVHHAIRAIAEIEYGIQLTPDEA